MTFYYTYFTSKYAYILYNYAVSFDYNYEILFRSPKISTDMAVIALLYAWKHEK